MTLLALLRHGVTDWNLQRRIQGRTDTELSPAGRAALAGLGPPAGFEEANWWVSPLRRARETAALLGAGEATVDERLVEMAFGAYEGRLWEEVAAQDGAVFAANEARGLDFQPPGGESPRMVQARLEPFLRQLAGLGGRHVAVTHKGLIRALMARAWGWDMLGRPPARLDWRRAHVIGLDGAGRPVPVDLNRPLSLR